MNLPRNWGWYLITLLMILTVLPRHQTGTVLASQLNVSVCAPHDCGIDSRDNFVPTTLKAGDTVVILWNVGDQWVRISQGWVPGRWILGSDGFPLYDGEQQLKDCHGCWITNRTWFTRYPHASEGKALYYARGVMEAQARARGFDLTGYVGGIATASAAELGSSFWIKGPQGWEGPFLVVDVVQRNHVHNLVMNVDYVVEVDYNTARRWGILGRGSADIVLSRTPFVLTSRDFGDWWANMARFTPNPEGNWLWTSAWIK